MGEVRIEHVEGDRVLDPFAFGDKVKEGQYLYTEDFLDTLDRNLRAKWG